jgi:hypothetical protein
LRCKRQGGLSVRVLSVWLYVRTVQEKRHDGSVSGFGSRHEWREPVLAPLIGIKRAALQEVSNLGGIATFCGRVEQLCELSVALSFSGGPFFCCLALDFPLGVLSPFGGSVCIVFNPLSAARLCTEFCVFCIDNATNVLITRASAFKCCRTDRARVLGAVVSVWVVHNQFCSEARVA